MRARVLVASAVAARRPFASTEIARKNLREQAARSRATPQFSNFVIKLVARFLTMNFGSALECYQSLLAITLITWDNRNSFRTLK